MKDKRGSLHAEIKLHRNACGVETLVYVAYITRSFEDKAQDAGLRRCWTLDCFAPSTATSENAVIRIDGAARIAFGAADAAATTRELKGAWTWATQLIALSRGLGLRFVQPALINGSVGVILAPRGKLSRALTFTFKNDKVTELDVIGDPARLRALDFAVL